MKKIVGLLVAAFVFASMLVVPMRAHAQLFDNVCNSDTKDATVCQERNKGGQSKSDNTFYGPHSILMKATNLLALVVGIVAVFVIIVSGIRFIASSGDSGSISTARRAILYAVIGIVVAALARSIIAFVINRL